MNKTLVSWSSSKDRAWLVLDRSFAAEREGIVFADLRLASPAVV